MERSAQSSRPQVSCQNRTKELTMGPVSGRQHSNQLSQLRLQLGNRIRCRSIMTNLGCMMLKGRMKRLLTRRSSPFRSSGDGRPSERHFEGGYMWPFGEDVWKSFWTRDREEKQRRTRSLGVPVGRVRKLLESLMRVEQSFSNGGERAQKHVTKRISRWADSRAGSIVDVYMSTALPTVKSVADSSLGLSRTDGSLPQK